MLYSYIVKKLIRQSFDHINNHRWDEVVKAVAPNVHQRVPGAHSLGGERHDKEALRRWFERFGRVLPNVHLKVNNIWVKGWPWHTTVFAQWDHYPSRDSRIPEIDRGLPESEWVARLLGRPVVKAFNNILANSLATRGVPARTPGRICLSVAGDELSAKAKK